MNSLEAPAAVLRSEPLFFSSVYREIPTSSPRCLICSVGYGQGHHAAAEALAEEYRARGYSCRVCDPCALARPSFFAWTQAFYRFCVRRAPWLWGVTYSQTDTANWRKVSKMPLLGKLKQQMLQLLEVERPDVVLCTYPIYAYMLDALKAEGCFHGRYAVVVTDALEISRPWLQSAAPLVVVPDRYSAERVQAQFCLPPDIVKPLGFPVRCRFRPVEALPPPSAAQLRIVFGAYRSTRIVVRSVRALLTAYPQAHITLLCGNRAPRFRSLLAPECTEGRVEVLPTTERMAELFAESHLYIGKAGAATVFECYASRLPMLVNFALPGQEQGNLELLLRDGAGTYAESPVDVVQAVQSLLADGAACWLQMRAAMAAAGYDGAAARIADMTERRFFS